jgi:hypothetical protein
MEVHIWGPASATLDLRARLMRYLSAPLFPVPLRDLPCKLVLHEVPCATARVGEFEIAANLICHPGPTVGYRITSPQGVIAYYRIMNLHLVNHDCGCRRIGLRDRLWPTKQTC